MIKVRAREQYSNKDGFIEEVKTTEHKDGKFAHVYNGVLTIYDADVKFSDHMAPPAQAIAGYEPHGWLSWEKV